jgi:spoIIIJ-associated protein
MESENSVVVAAPSVEEAIIIGLTRLTATRDEVEIEVMDEGSRGFLGIGAREARVRVSCKPAEAVRAEAEVQGSTPVESISQPEPEREAEVVAEPESARIAAPTEEQELPAPPATAAPEAEEVATPEASSRPEPRRARPVERKPSERPSRRSDDTQRAPRAQRPSGAALNREQLEPIAKEITSGLLPGLDIETSIEWVEEDRPTLWINIGGRDADALVGPRARNLHAAQYMIRALIYRRLDGDYNVVVDADGYRKRRRRSLESLAESKADRAVELGRTIRLRPMPAHERRIVHIALRQDERVATESVGKGRDRAVTIVPKVPSDPNPTA